MRPDRLNPLFVSAESLKGVGSTLARPLERLGLSRVKDFAYHLPDRFVTNICFGGKDMRTAYVTLSGSGRLIAIDDWPVPGLKLNCEA